MIGAGSVVRKTNGKSPIVVTQASQSKLQGIYLSSENSVTMDRNSVVEYTKALTPKEKQKLDRYL